MQGLSDVLVIDDNSDRRAQLELLLGFVGESCRITSSSNISLINSEDCWRAVFIGDIADEDPLEFIQRLASVHPLQPYVLLGDDKGVVLPNLVGSLMAPFNYPQMTEVIHRCQDYHRKRPGGQPQTSTQTKLFRSLVGRSDAIAQVRQLIEQVSVTDANVLVLGDSGTGKEVVARNIHYLSSRRDGPFVPVNCGAIPAELLESELFGHEKGAFTGAITTRKGRFELAQGGTLFLDEIGDMPTNMQVKLLRVLQERVFERVGSAKLVKADVRIVAATHRNLEGMIAEGKFREDLYYRLNVFPIEMPALCERQDDIPLLLQELVSRLEAEHNASVRFTDKAIDSLMLHPWSGNVRELSNLVERLVILYPNGVVDVSDLPPKYRHIDVDPYEPVYSEEVMERESLNALFREDAEPLIAEPQVPHELPDEGINLKEMLSELETDYIQQALVRQDWVVARAAEQLGMRRTTLVEKMRKYQIARDDE
ncbi:MULTISPECIES: sigma-54 dependent transcriptional regulator [Corallincola]|uniref:Sigma-54-dependent Fis family transcriptional regulator n=3 Tax=Corallincola TaxID=1775176 RepID=A0A368N4R7_9GAMM|nr:MULTISPECIES: sigma-54 dependent transcriptional regulator [Corallincola]RCU44574.1 sigma-54-dependent Fis family transcriptional regulator [Corallincola holothuriorum]TAA40319.1 sigma-54-dependent Fis family transcriptional regulator [Corallincola spongiicola]TCI05374.1 sigma-54-dependent Fis family transcriptional regulator [Corallincola luteus]